MSGEVFVVMTNDEKMDYRHRGLNPWQSLADKFKKEHDLTFDPAEFDDMKRFRFEAAPDCKSYKITYLGDGNDKS